MRARHSNQFGRARWHHLAQALLLVLAACGFAPWAHAHKASDAYLMLVDGGPPATAPGTLGLQLSLALKDLDAAIDTLDADNDRQLRWAEIKAAQPAIARWAGEGIRLRCAGSAMAPTWAMQSLEQRSDGVYVRLGASMACAPAAGLTLDYQLMKDIDATHRLLISGTLQGRPVAAVVAPQPGRSAMALRAGTAGGAATAQVPAAGGQSGWATLANFFAEGVHHIVTGYDHLAFLLALLLPIVLRPRAPGPSPAARADGDAKARRPGLAALVLTVTGFTIGHSCTLVLASLGLIAASPAWVEPAIAITIAISAALNLYPLRWLRGDALALGFGLVHGLGFSGVMAEAGVTGPLLVWALAGFNLGVEAGQLACVLAWCAVHLLLVRWRHYDQVVVRGGSWALIALALYWALERIAG